MTEGYIYAPIKPQERIDEIVMFRDSAQLSKRSEQGSFLATHQWRIYKNTVIIDVDDFSMREIRKHSLSLRNLGEENLTGVALRYEQENGDKIDVQSIRFPGNDGRFDQSTQRNDASWGRNPPPSRAVANDNALRRPVQNLASNREARHKQYNDAQDKLFDKNFEKTKTEYDQSRIDAVEKCIELMRTDEQVGQMLSLIHI